MATLLTVEQRIASYAKQQAAAMMPTAPIKSEQPMQAAPAGHARAPWADRSPTHPSHVERRSSRCAWGQGPDTTTLPMACLQINLQPSSRPHRARRTLLPQTARCQPKRLAHEHDLARDYVTC